MINYGVWTVTKGNDDDNSNKAKTGSSPVAAERHMWLLRETSRSVYPVPGFTLIQRLIGLYGTETGSANVSSDLAMGDWFISLLGV